MKTHLTDEIAKVRKELEATAAKLKKLEEEASKPTPWEPKGGGNWLNAMGSVNVDTTHSSRRSREGSGCRLAGSEYPTYAAAMSALPYVTFFKRLCCLAAELNPSGKVGGEYMVYPRTTDSRWCAADCAISSGWDTLFETPVAAESAARIMNRDKWSLPKV